jgi:hypothetical protein
MEFSNYPSVMATAAKLIETTTLTTTWTLPGMKTCQCCFNENYDTDKNCTFCRGTFFSKVIWAVNGTIFPTTFDINSTYYGNVVYTPNVSTSSAYVPIVSTASHVVTKAPTSSSVTERQCRDSFPVVDDSTNVVETSTPMTKKRKVDKSTQREPHECVRCGTINAASTRFCSGRRLKL